MKSRSRFYTEVMLLLLCCCLPVKASLLSFEASLSGANENPPNASPGSGLATLLFDTDSDSMLLQVSFADLIGVTTAAHIHCCVLAPGNVGVASATPFFPGFPLGVSSGNYAQMFDLTLAGSFNPAFINANGGLVQNAAAALLAGLLSGEAYLNIHSTAFPGGEVRGFFTQQTVVDRVPAPTSLISLLSLLLMLSWRRLCHPRGKFLQLSVQ